MNIPSHEYCKECKDWNGNISNCMEICGIPMDIIKEWEKYHAIGTPEECRAAVEKQKAIKPLGGKDLDGNEYDICRECSAIVSDGDWHAEYCPDCGQKVDWKDD